jgi:ATPase family associated with various cellular activities (AAA)/Winged helix domain, variant
VTAVLEQAPIVAALARIREALDTKLDRLAELFALTPFERDVLLLAASVELDGEVAAQVAGLQDGEPRPTFGLALAELPDAHWDALAPDSPLRRNRLVEPTGGGTITTRPLRIDERVLHAVTGIESTDDRLAGIVRRAAEPIALSGSQHALAAELARTAPDAGSRLVIRLDGDDVDARLGVAQAFAQELRRHALVVRASALPAPGPELADVARLVDRETLLSYGVPVVAADDAGDAVVAALLDELEAPLVVLVGETGARATGRVTLHRSVVLPSAVESRELWREAVGDVESVEELAQHFRLSATAVDAIGRELHASPDADLRRLCRERSRVPLEGLAERIDPAATWDDLVLPVGHRALLREIVLHVRHRTQVYERWGFGARTSRGLGVTALFTGESGTGKTLAAEVLARELGLDLYRIDLAATVSKYIGETEKNLRRVFDAAEASGAVLLFDEADALFGKRGEVKDGHDRYANLEVAYLLQRMESYRGLAILTTNLRSNVDRAFLRRLRFVVQFPFPDAEQRAEIWRRTLPAEAPVDGLDVDALARLNVSGGSIRSIALAAAFSAAENGGALTPAHVLRAARVEYAKAERALTDGEVEALR